MPPRHFVLAIVLFWLATSGWLFYRDLWPRLRRGNAPPFTIDLAFEAQRRSSESAWTIVRNDQRIGMVHTWVDYRAADDSFELHSTIKKLDLGWIGPAHIQANELSGMYRVTREGALREMLAEGTLDVQGNVLVKNLHVSALVHLDGAVQGERFIPHGHINLDGYKEDLKLEPVEFSPKTSVLNPLHPVNRIAGLRRGQHWQQRLVDPLAESLKAMAQKVPLLELVIPKSSAGDVLQAEVLSKPQTLTWEGNPVSCLVIEYRSDRLTAYTWVRESDGKVLRQEATLGGERLVLERL